MVETITEQLGKSKGNPDIHKYGFGANPQNINRKGRPKKSWGRVNEMLQQKGVEKLSKQDLVDAYALIFNSTEEDLEEIMDDPEVPFAMKAMISSMQDKKFRDQAMRDYRDYMFGRSASQVEVTFKEQPLFPDIGHGKVQKELPVGQPRTIDAEFEEIPAQHEETKIK